MSDLSDTFAAVLPFLALAFILTAFALSFGAPQPTLYVTPHGQFISTDSLMKVTPNKIPNI